MNVSLNPEPDKLVAGKMADGHVLPLGAPAEAESGNPSDESTGTGGEIEHVESPGDEPKLEPGESAAGEGDVGGARCPIRMGDFGDLKCGRKLCDLQGGPDNEPVCLMHTKDSRKQSGPLLVEFLREFERTLEDAGEGEASFERFVFPQLDFSQREFRARCRFNFATFSEGINFRRAIFAQGANFNSAIFTQDANFDSASFAQDASFNSAIFTEDANFESASFTQDASFWRATFTQAARFVDTKFYGTVNWIKSRFLDRAEFRRTKFDPLVEGQPAAVFALASFSKPSEIVFDDVELSRALFHDCDVSQVSFSSSVRWGRRRGKRGHKVFEETIDLNQEFGKELERNGERDYRKVEQIYQQLKKNYDARLDYWTANEFHFGEMEMKRLAAPTDGRLLWLRRWLHPRLSPVALYRCASNYGNSYWKPFLWLLLTLALFAALLPFPATGLKRQGAAGRVETYISAWDFQNGYSGNLRSEGRLVLKSAITAVDTATFQRSPEYTPAYPGGRVLAISETLLTSSLFALFLLAIRRQFRR
jgi:hypothetical protein